MFYKSSNRAERKHILKANVRLKYHGISIWKFKGEIYMSAYTHIHDAYFLKSCRKSYNNGIVSYLKHMERGRILECSYSGGFSIGRWRTCSAIRSGKQVWQATVVAAPTFLSQQVLLWHKNSLWGIQENTKCKMKEQNIKSFSEWRSYFPSIQATKPVANKQRSYLAAS